MDKGATYLEITGLGEVKVDSAQIAVADPASYDLELTPSTCRLGTHRLYNLGISIWIMRCEW